VHPEDGSAPKTMAGRALSVLRRTPDARWVIFRDANMLTPVDRAPP
jgi:ketosteroid isomerase-like protein